MVPVLVVPLPAHPSITCAPHDWVFALPSCRLALILPFYSFVCSITCLSHDPPFAHLISPSFWCYSSCILLNNRCLHACYNESRRCLLPFQLPPSSLPLPAHVPARAFLNPIHPSESSLHSGLHSAEAWFEIKRVSQSPTAVFVSDLSWNVSFPIFWIRSCS